MEEGMDSKVKVVLARILVGVKKKQKDGPCILSRVEVLMKEEWLEYI